MIGKYLGQGMHVISMDEYQADPCPEPSLSSGIIKTLVSECPFKAWFKHPRLNKNYNEANGTSFDMGTVCHALMLEGDDIAEPLDFDDWRTKASKEKAQEARKAGKIPMLRYQYDDAFNIVSSAEEQLAESEIPFTRLRDQGVSESTYIWQERNGVWCRIRPDWVSKDKQYVIDLKFTGLSASPYQYSRQMDNVGYDIQAALYTRGINKIENIEAKFIFFVVETSPPFLACPMTLSPSFMNLGKQKCLTAIDHWKHHLSTNDWPGYPKRICHVDPPGWAETRWEERRFDMEMATQEEEPI